MRRLFALFILAIAAGILTGCDPAPSTTLAPDKPAPDASKMSSAEMDSLLKKNHEEGRP